jgi:hypothetical protein
MRKILSKEHADQLTRVYMKTGLDHHVMQGIHSRKAAMYDILAEREQLPKTYDMHRSCAGQCHCND